MRDKLAKYFHSPKRSLERLASRNVSTKYTKNTAWGGSVCPWEDISDLNSCFRCIGMMIRKSPPRDTITAASKPCYAVDSGRKTCSGALINIGLCDGFTRR